MWKKSLILFVVFLLASFNVVGQANDSASDRGFMLFGGLGFAGIGYDDETQEILNEIEDTSGVDRFKLYMNLGLGFAVSQRVYLTGSLNVYGDSYTYEDSMIEEELDITLFNLAAGVRFYPEVTGWVTGFDIGPAAGVISFDASDLEEELSSESDDGLGFGIMLGYDFSQRPTGISAIVGARADLFQIDNESFGLVALFLNPVFK